MSDRPILFSDAMVLKLLARQKTQTRRIINPPPDWDHPGPCCIETPEGWQGPLDYSLWAHEGDRCDGDPRRCRYGRPGDRLYVREAWTRIGDPGFVAYRADYPRCLPDHATPAGMDPLPSWALTWKPSIHLKKVDSRLWLDVTRVRVQRLQDISGEDAIDEGIEPAQTGDGREESAFNRADYAALWESINGAGSWDLNPWVWAITFDIHETARGYL